jgi:hypothetical protein
MQQHAKKNKLTRFRDQHISDQYEYMIKDLHDTGKPYKNSIYGYYIWRDLFQFLRGLWNLAQSLVFLFAAPFIYIGGLVANIFPQFRGEQTYKTAMTRVHTTAMILLRASAAHFVRGLTQVLTVPLTWLFRIPMRLIKTIIKGGRTLEESYSLISSVSELGLHSEQDIQGLVESTQILHAKFQKARLRGISSKISPKEEKRAYFDAKVKKESKNGDFCYSINVKAVPAYVKLFQKAINSRREEKSAKRHQL